MQLAKQKQLPPCLSREKENFLMGFPCYSYTSMNLVFYILLIHLSFSHLASCKSPLCHDDERYALLQFKESLTIDEDASDYSFAYPKVSSWKADEGNVNCCTWKGITCSEDTGHVVKLDLTSSFLYGSINSNSSLFHLVHLEWLSLADNAFDNSKIPSRIMNLSRLSHLDLSYSVFSGEIPSEILELSNLVFLNVSHNDLEHQNWDLLGSLAEALTNLKMLDLSNVYIYSPIPHSLAKLSSLTSLSLEDCGLQGEFPSEIFQLPNLQLLNVRFNEDLTVYLPEFGKNCSLEELRLGRTRFCGRILNSLVNLKSLSHLDLSGCNISEKLQVNSSSLTSLSLAQSRVSGGIINSLSNLKSLSHLDLSGCNISGKLQVNSSSLTSLSLQECRLQGELFSEIFRLPNLQFLNVRDNEDLVICLSDFENSSSLESLSIVGTRVSSGIPNSLGNLKSLSHLDLSGCNISGKLQVNSSSLTSLSLEECRLQGELFSEIFQLPNLQILNVIDNEDLTICLSDFEISTSLESLSIAGTRVSGGIPNSLGTLKSLSYLYMEDCNPSGSILSSISNLTHIRVLRLARNEISGELSSLGNLDSLKELDISSNNLTGPIPYSLMNSNKLFSLRLSNNQLSGQIPFEIKNLTQLSVLDLGSNQLEGPIPSSLFELKNLQSLYIGWNNLSGTLDLNTFLSKLKNLEAFSLSSNNLSLLTNSTVHSYSQKFSSVGLRACNLSVFPNFLQKQEQLYYLDLSSNKIAGHVPGWLLNMSIDRLEYLNLSHNQLTGFHQLPAVGLD